MNDSHITSITQIKEFLKLDKGIQFKSVSKKERNQWLEEALIRFEYFRLRKRDKAKVKEYVMRMTGLSDAQLTRLIARKKRFGKIWFESTRRHRFSRKYTPEDIARLIETDNFHLRISGPATKGILEREYQKFGKEEYQNISQISSSHIYNLRATRTVSVPFFNHQEDSTKKDSHRRKKKARTPGQTRLFKSRFRSSGRLR